jgi:hypothetical protein
MGEKSILPASGCEHTKHPGAGQKHHLRDHTTNACDLRWKFVWMLSSVIAPLAHSETFKALKTFYKVIVLPLRFYQDSVQEMWGLNNFWDKQKNLFFGNRSKTI